MTEMHKCSVPTGQNMRFNLNSKPDSDVNQIDDQVKNSILYQSEMYSPCLYFLRYLFERIIQMNMYAWIPIVRPAWFLKWILWKSAEILNSSSLRYFVISSLSVEWSTHLPASLDLSRYFCMCNVLHYTSYCTTCTGVLVNPR